MIQTKQNNLNFQAYPVQGFNLEWQTLNRLLPQKYAPSILKDLTSILNTLQDSKSK